MKIIKTIKLKEDSLIQVIDMEDGRVGIGSDDSAGDGAFVVLDKNNIDELIKTLKVFI